MTISKEFLKNFQRIHKGGFSASKFDIGNWIFYVSFYFLYFISLNCIILYYIKFYFLYNIILLYIFYIIYFIYFYILFGFIMFFLYFNLLYFILLSFIFLCFEFYFLCTNLLEIKRELILSRFWGNFVSMEKEGGRFLILRSASASLSYIKMLIFG